MTLWPAVMLARLNVRYSPGSHSALAEIWLQPPVGETPVTVRGLNGTA